MKGPHSGDAFLQVAAGPDVSEDGHAAMLCFIRTCRNRKTTPVGGRNKRGFSPLGSMPDDTLLTVFPASWRAPRGSPFNIGRF